MTVSGILYLNINYLPSTFSQEATRECGLSTEGCKPWKRKALDPRNRKYEEETEEFGA